VAATTNNGGAAVYSIMDVAPAPGVNYYRIKTINTSGSITYTTIVKVSYGSTKPGIALISTLITNGQIGIQFNGQDKGRYAVRVINSIGQEVLKTTFEHPGGKSTQNITLPSVDKGIYQVQLLKTGEMKIIEKIVIF